MFENREDDIKKFPAPIEWISDWKKTSKYIIDSIWNGITFTSVNDDLKMKCFVFQIWRKTDVDNAYSNIYPIDQPDILYYFLQVEGFFFKSVR